MTFHDFNICTDCGEEIERGLFNTIKHSGKCLRNAPNENIESYRYHKELEDIRKKAKLEFIPIYNQMTKQERFELATLSVVGTRQGNTILMGMEAFKKYEAYRNKMIDKYQFKHKRSK